MYEIDLKVNKNLGLNWGFVTKERTDKTLWDIKICINQSIVTSWRYVYGIWGYMKKTIKEASRVVWGRKGEVGDQERTCHAEPCHEKANKTSKQARRIIIIIIRDKQETESPKCINKITEQQEKAKPSPETESPNLTH